VTCSSCGAQNEFNRRYCGRCGTQVRKNCPRCGFGNGLTDRHCGGCADSLSAFEAQSEAIAGTPGAPPVSRDSGALISSKDLEELLQKPAPPVASTLSSRVSQNELDKLFGAAK
jgi:Double zinc ribbon